MKMPVPPPDLDRIRQDLTHDPDNYVRIMTAFTPSIATSDYLSWDQLRYQKPPEGLTVEQWWYQLKSARAMMRRQLPLVDKAGVAFSYVLPDKVLEYLDDISRRASGQIAISEPVTNPATRDRYVISSLIEEAITSSQLEGAVTSRQVAKEMIRSGRPPRDKSERMILNNYRAMRFVSYIDPGAEITPDLICEIHRIVTDETLDSPEMAGVLQSDPDTRVAVFGDGNQIIHNPPPVDQLDARLKALCKFANGFNGGTYIHPVLRALAVHFMVGYDHYFEDGNGRTARALFYLIMLREGYWLTEFLTISKILKQAPAKYPRSFVLTEQDDGDLTYFFLYHLRIIQRAIEDLNDYLARKVTELRETRILLEASPGEFNHRQLALIELALRDSSSYFTIISHSTSHKVSEQTARNDLNDLAQRGLLTRDRQGKKFVWHPTSKLAEHIRRVRSA